MRKLRTIQDVVDWGMCVGCGACFAICEKPQAVELVHIPEVGIRPRFNERVCAGCHDCLEICPGYAIDARRDDSGPDLFNRRTDPLVGPTYGIWEGHATDGDIRHFGSSGGILTALTLYALEKERMAFVLHTGMDCDRPWQNKTTVSRTRADLLSNAGSRYAPSSPCDLLRLIEKSDRPCVFIGKPCDAAAVNMMRKIRPSLDANLGLVLSFFCAGTPSTNATLELLRKMGIESNQVDSIRYRGEGWPGSFRASGELGSRQISYEMSWAYLQNFRPFRCHLCPDGLGELSDITCGDAWHRYNSSNMSNGISLVLARNSKGNDFIKRALRSGYVELGEAETQNVIEAQGLVQRRQQLFGRLLAMKLMMVPTTNYSGFQLFETWKNIPAFEKVKSLGGTFKRIMKKELWRKSCPTSTSIK